MTWRFSVSARPLGWRRAEGRSRSIAGNRRSTGASTELAAAAITACDSWTKREPQRAEAWFYLAGSYAQPQSSFAGFCSFPAAIGTRGCRKCCAPIRSLASRLAFVRARIARGSAFLADASDRFGSCRSGDPVSHARALDALGDGAGARQQLDTVIARETRPRSSSRRRTSRMRVCSSAPAIARARSKRIDAPRKLSAAICARAIKRARR